jgi:hypothetical protein
VTLLLLLAAVIVVCGPAIAIGILRFDSGDVPE